ncbi:MAG: division/cell wall cluster transcriptional repressor MraZ [Flavobacteriales bacterium]
MAGFIGEYEVKLDDKGRFVLPAGIKKQLEPTDHDTFVVNRGFEQQLNLYTMKEWENLMSRVTKKVNQFTEEGRRLLRQFRNGAVPVSIDSSGRLLLPQNLMQYAGIKKELTVVGAFDRVELWDRSKYEQEMKEGLAEFSMLAEKLLGNLGEEDGQ